MARISPGFVLIALLLLAASLFACNPVDQLPDPSATPAGDIRIYEGYYLCGEARHGIVFVPCEADNKPVKEKMYWLVTNAQFDEMFEVENRELIAATIGTLPPGGEFGMYMKFKGIAAPPSEEGYGYQNQYPGQITVTEAILMKYFIVPWDEDLCKSK